MGFTDPITPCTGQSRRLVHMTVECQEGPALLDEIPYGNASHVDVERHMVHLFRNELGPVEFCSVRGCVEQEDRTGKVVLPGELYEILGDRGVLFFVFGKRDGTHSLVGRHTAGIDVAGHIVALPILELEWRRRDEGVAVDRVSFEGGRLIVDAVPQTSRGGMKKGRFVEAPVIVSENQKNTGIGTAHSPA